MMEQKLKERLVGAAVLVAVAVIFIPIILNDSPESEAISGSNIPAKPETNFNSRIIPIIENNENTTSAPIESKSNDSGKSQKENVEEVIKEIVVEKIDTDDDKSTQITSSKKENREDEVKANVGLSAWIVQLGSFTDEDNAQSLNIKLRKAGYPAFVEPLKTNGKISYRVRVGPEIKRSEAELLLEKLKEKMKLDGIVVSYP
jgi:DedD protein